MCCYKRAHLVWIFLVVLLIVALRVHAQDLEPRAYSNAPGKGRLLDCLKKHDKQISKRCKQAVKDVSLK
jgi:hypothetical protein